MLEKMVHSLAHEIKNPLSLATVSIDLLDHKDECADNKSNYSIIRKELSKINDIVMEFLNITKPAGDDFDLVYLGDILKEIIETNSSAYQHITFNFSCETDAPVLGSNKTITILFNNIIKNAVEAIQEKGYIHISIVEHNGNIVTTVEDTGSGIGDDIKDKVAVDFYTTKKNGTGIGLGICQKIVQDHNGTFTLSNGNIGCKASVIIPSV